MLSKKSKEGARSGKSSSEEWHSEEEVSESDTDILNVVERGHGDDEVSPVEVGKPHRGVQNPQVSVLTSYWVFSRSESFHLWWHSIRFSCKPYYGKRIVYLRRLDECLSSVYQWP